MRREHRPNHGTTPIAVSPLRDTSIPNKRSIIGHHLILHAYGHWLPNDPRGSGSEKLREEKLADLGPIHQGRRKIQPPRAALKKFQHAAKPRLDYPPLWFDNAKRQAVADAFGRVVAVQRYTVWGCAVLRNHAHLCIRRHRDDALTMWNRFAEESSNALRLCVEVSDDHPIWSSRPYKVFLYTPDDVRRVVTYITENPVKGTLSPQRWPFVKPYDNWPYHRQTNR